MHASLSRSRTQPMASYGALSGTLVDVENGAAVTGSLSRIPAEAPIRRKCKSCENEENGGLSVSPKLEVGAIDHPAEREADLVADRVMTGRQPASASEPGGGQTLRAKANGGGGAGTMPLGAQQSSAVAALGSGEQMSAADRGFFEPRMGEDLSHVRLHRGHRAEEAAESIGARAFTMGSDIVLGAGEYGSDHASRHLLAHELAHVQQNQHGGAGGTLRMTQLDIVDAGTTTVPQAHQRQAALSCPISCDGTSIGTFHAMPLFHHTSRGAPGASGGNGIGASLHFMQSGTIPAGNACASCSSYEVVQVIRSNEPADPRGNQSFVDNANIGVVPNGRSPYYTKIYLSGHGRHTIPANYPDAGNQITSSVSLYDRPYREPAHLQSIRGTDFFWEGEACVTCAKGGTVASPSPDKILGCVTYGFRRRWNSGSSSYDDAVKIAPGCRSGPSQHFVDTLHNDPTTSGKYWFTT